MADQNFNVRYFQANVIVYGTLALLAIAFLAVFGGIGFAIAHVTHGNPAWDSGVKVGIGLLFLALGLSRLFRMAVYGPKRPTQNRMQDSVINSAWILLGVSHFTTHALVERPALALAIILMLAATFRRPRSGLLQYGF